MLESEGHRFLQCDGPQILLHFADEPVGIGARDTTGTFLR